MLSLAAYLNQQPQAGQLRVEKKVLAGVEIPQFINSFWTAKQRAAVPLHEVSYRACFKPQLPHFFLAWATQPKDLVYDPFSGRGTTALEAGLLGGRQVIINDINPLSRILTEARFFVPTEEEIADRLATIDFQQDCQPDCDLSMFYHPQTEKELLSLREYLSARQQQRREDALDKWIRMVATNRLTGHSPGFFSVYTLPPNQAVTPARQIILNQKNKRSPEYRHVPSLIIKKTASLIQKLTVAEKENLRRTGWGATFLTADARSTPQIPSQSITLTVTSPPFLDVVQYSTDNWLRCWFNHLDSQEIAKKINLTHSLAEWQTTMWVVLTELHRITKPQGIVAFEVGEIKNRQIKLDEIIVPLGLQVGFDCLGVMINEQSFTKTANIWGVNNNVQGTNTNRIVVFQKKP